MRFWFDEAGLAPLFEGVLLPVAALSELLFLMLMPFAAIIGVLGLCGPTAGPAAGVEESAFPDGSFVLLGVVPEPTVAVVAPLVVTSVLRCCISFPAEEACMLRTQLFPLIRTATKSRAPLYQTIRASNDRYSLKLSMFVLSLRGNYYSRLMMTLRAALRLDRLLHCEVLPCSLLSGFK